MSALSLFISTIALAAALVAIWMVRRPAINNGGAVRAVANYTITGNVSITNDCDGMVNSIPARVMVKTELSNQAGTITVPGNAVINVVQDPANPGNPIKIGTYTITVRWLDANNDPTHWVSPAVFDAFGAMPVCGPISCPAGSACTDMVPAANVPFNNPTTNHDIRVVCACR